VDQKLDGKETRGVQRGKHEELVKDDGKVRLIKAADSGQMAYKERKENKSGCMRRKKSEKKKDFSPTDSANRCPVPIRLSPSPSSSTV